MFNKFFEGMTLKNWLTFLSLIAVVVIIFLIARPVPECVEEDGSGQNVCVWNASHHGNGHGLSYVIKNGNIVEYL